MLGRHKVEGMPPLCDLLDSSNGALVAWVLVVAGFQITEPNHVFNTLADGCYIHPNSGEDFLCDAHFLREVEMTQGGHSLFLGCLKR